MKRILLEPAFVLHRRSYRETSFLVELFSPLHGRFSAVAKGVRKPRSAAPGLLQPFVPVLVSLAGKGELLALTEVEPRAEVLRLQGDCLFAGFYLNELLMCLLQKWDAHPGLFAMYEKTLQALQAPQLNEGTLRSFEKYLLEELGYGVLPKSAISLHNTFCPEKYYRFVSEQGFVVCEAAQSMMTNVFLGAQLIAIAQEKWDEASLKDAKRLIRYVLGPLLGTRALHSRKLFMQPRDEVEMNNEK